MTTSGEITVTLAADVNQVDDTGFVWAFLSDPEAPERVRPGAIIVAGDPVEPFLARVIDVVDGPGDDWTVHLDVLGVAEVDRWHQRLRRDGLGDAQIRNLHTPLRAVVHRDVRSELLPDQPSRR